MAFMSEHEDDTRRNHRWFTDQLLRQQKVVKCTGYLGKQQHLLTRIAKPPPS